MYILSVNINVPIAIKTTPEIFDEDFWKATNIRFLRFNLPDKIEIVIKGIDRPIEKLTNSPIPWFKVSELDVSVNKAPSTGPIHGVNPNAKVKPSIKFLKVEKFFKST